MLLLSRCLRYLGLFGLVLWLAPLPVRGQPAALEIYAARVVPDSVLHLEYRMGEAHRTLDIPLVMMNDIVAQLVAAGERPPPPPAPEPVAPPAERRLLHGEVRFETPATGYRYRVFMIADSLVEVTYEKGPIKETVRLPGDANALDRISRHYMALAGIRRSEPDELFLDWKDMRFWFRTEQSGSLLPVAGVLLLLIVGVPGLLLYRKFDRIRAERDELAASRQRMIEAREAERTHLAAELHDGPVQELQRVLRAYLLPLSRVIPEADAETARTLEEAREALQHVTGELRNLCTELRPPVLVHFGLDKAIRSYVRLFEERHPDITVTLDLDVENKTLPMPVRLALFRICQEALNNVSKHARAHHVKIVLRLGETVQLSIHDDGQGFRPPRRWLDLEREGHLGLSGLAQRAEAIGGHLEVLSAPGEGTTVRVVAPRQVAEPETALAS